jgi:glycosyltransferase involved in cell wall biosynthesis
MKTIYILDTKGNLDARKSDVISRHLKYAESFDQKCGTRGENGRIVVLSRNVNQPNFGSKYLDVIVFKKSKRLHQYFWRTRNFLSREEGKTVALIAGDPWHSTVIALLIKLFIRKRVRIESQLHFDFINFFRSSGFFLSRVLPKITLMILRLVDQIRVVDRNSLKLLQNTMNADIEIYYAPSLISVDPTFLCSRTPERNHEPRLLFVGRLHEERNPSEFIKFLRLLDSKGFKYNARIVGAGPLARELNMESSDLVARKVLRFTGELSGRELLEEYCRSDVLISCAKHESYGRALREAIYMGAKVLTFETTGASALQEEVGAKYVKYVSSDINPDQLISRIEGLFKTEVDSKTKQQLSEGQDTILKTLSDRWDTLINKSV